MWKQVEDFDTRMEAEREVVESILEKTITKYQLNAADINVQVPGMLLQVCEDEIIKVSIARGVNAIVYEICFLVQ